MNIDKLQLAGGNSRGDRRALDFYPTPKNVTVALLDFLDIPKGRIIWEPCCGDHAMSNVIKSYGYSVLESDIIYGDDFLKTTKKCDAIITNPPFKLAEEIIKKAVTESRIVAMLLKSQFWHAKKRHDLFKKFPPTYVLPLTWRPDFLEHTRKPGDKKGRPTMDVCWSVWKFPLNSQTVYRPLEKPTKL